MSTEALETRAKRGDVEAQLELGQQYEAQNNAAGARALFATAAKAGSVAGLRCLGINLLMLEPIEADKGVNMLRAAADGGDADAAFICANLAANDSELPDRWKVALECLAVAAERGSTFAREQLDFLETHPTDFETLVLPQRQVFAEPRISVIEGFASQAECDWLIARAQPRLHPALVYDPVAGSGTKSGTRSNSSVAFSVFQSDIILLLLRARIEAITGVDRLEGASILHYAPGQEFKPHFDFLDPVNPGHARDIKKNGQRVATFLVYLNDDYEGGETEFPRLDWRYKGRKGDALLFWNVDMKGEADRKTYHAGTPTTKGEKWLFSQWLRRPPV